jgi:hypothetical protein
MENHKDAWRKYRIIRNAFAFVFISFVPIVFAVAKIGEKLFRSDKAGYILAFAWMLAFGVLLVVLKLWRCPRCGKPFSGFALLDPKKCAFCGLPKP